MPIFSRSNSIFLSRTLVLSWSIRIQGLRPARPSRAFVRHSARKAFFHSVSLLLGITIFQSGFGTFHRKDFLRAVTVFRCTRNYLKYSRIPCSIRSSTSLQRKGIRWNWSFSPLPVWPKEAFNCRGIFMNPIRWPEISGFLVRSVMVFDRTVGRVNTFGRSPSILMFSFRMLRVGLLFALAWLFGLKFFMNG